MGEYLASDIGALLAAVLLVAALALAVLSARRWLLERSGGTVECSLRAISGEGQTGVWRLGIGRYHGDELHWFRIFGLRPRPRHVIHRRGLDVSGRRFPSSEEAAGLPPDAGIVELRDGDHIIELAMNSAALTGFLAWLEAAPPGFPIDPGS